jgi:hypothetical protein
LAVLNGYWNFHTGHYWVRSVLIHILIRLNFNWSESKKSTGGNLPLTQIKVLNQNKLIIMPVMTLFLSMFGVVIFNNIDENRV